MAKKVIINKSSRKEKSTDKFIRFMFLLNNKSRFQYRGYNSLWFGLITYNKYNNLSLKQYIEEMKEYDRKIGNLKRVHEIEKIENLSEEEILEYGKQKYKEFWKQLNKEVNLEIKEEKKKRRHFIYEN